jgi:hypothetical protein
MGSVTFLTAKQARDKSRNNILVHSEVGSIETSILQAIDDGFYECIVNNTTMCADPEFYKVINLLKDDRVRLEQIQLVTQYFVDLGYTIRARPNSNTNNTIEWVIKW